LRAGLRDVTAVSSASQRQQRIVYGAQNMTGGVTGTDNDYFVARDGGVSLGREFCDSELRSGTPVCILGETVRRDLYGAGNPIDDLIRVGRMSCTIIGVLDAKGTTGFGQDQDNVVLVPVTTYQRRIAG